MDRQAAWGAPRFAGKYFPWEDYADKIDWELQQVGSSLKEMQKIGVKNFPRKRPLYFREGEPARFFTPSRRIELYSKQLAQKGFDPMPVYTPPEPVPHGYYRLNYGRMPAHTFGKTTNNPLLFQLAPENQLWVNPLVAKRTNLKVATMSGSHREKVRLAARSGCG